MAIVGYLEGTDSVLLTRLACRGIETLPISNGADSHGKVIGILTPDDNVSVVVGYLHKLVPVAGVALTPKNLLQACMVYNIKVLIMVPEEEHETAGKILSSVADFVEYVDPAEAYRSILRITG